MNILDFIKYPGAHVRTASGHDVTIDNIVNKDQFPIKGRVHHPTGVSLEYEWDLDGNPHKLPLTHGLNLRPFITKTIYVEVDKHMFKKASSFADIVVK